MLSKAGLAALAALLSLSQARNSSYTNPILPGFHPDPSCIFVPEWDDTFFCASSSFLAFPGIPIHASRDLRSWTLAGNALHSPTQIPGLGTAKRATSGIWAPTLRYHKGTFYIVTTMVYDDPPKDDPTRWDNFIIHSKNPYSSSSWSQPVHFSFVGYDTSPFWDDDGSVYITGSHTYEVWPGINQGKMNLETGEWIGELVNVWNGTGGLAPEGPHVYKKDGWYYLQLAEGGTGYDHMVTLARSKDINGPYTPAPHNPVLSNANITNPAPYFQDVGHADLFSDANGNWWAVALSVRNGPDGSQPMGRETVLTPVTWTEGQWPVYQNISGDMSGWMLPSHQVVQEGEGDVVDANQHLTFREGSSLPPELVHWRFPTGEGNYEIAPHGHKDSLKLASSIANLTGMDGRSAEPLGQTFIGKRQTHSLFSFSANFDIEELDAVEQETGVTVFLDQLHHYDLGIVLLPDSNASSPTAGTPIPHFRVRGITTVPVFLNTSDTPIPVPSSWLGKGKQIRLEIKASNITHYALSAGPVGMMSQTQLIGWGNGLGLTWGFTGALVGAYATSNGANNSFNSYVSEWTYQGHEQFIN
ncbi:beta-xylosidase [Xylogone sp. PMI_703]|nr:beta-xylosidase [Xylogone sp. PMI_703]